LCKRVCKRKCKRVCKRKCKRVCKRKCKRLCKVWRDHALDGWVSFAPHSEHTPAVPAG